MILSPIDDKNSDFTCVTLYSINNVPLTPHCTKHGAMNKVSVFPDGGGYWRCISTVSKYNDNNCRSGCIEIK